MGPSSSLQLLRRELQGRQSQIFGSGRPQEKGQWPQKLLVGRFRTDIIKILPEGMVQYQSMLSGEAVESPSLEVFNI